MNGKERIGRRTTHQHRPQTAGTCSSPKLANALPSLSNRRGEAPGAEERGRFGTRPPIGEGTAY